MLRQPPQDTQAQTAQRRLLQDFGSTVGPPLQTVCQYIAVQRMALAAANPVSATGRGVVALMAGIGGIVSRSPSQAFVTKDGKPLKVPVVTGP